MVRINLEFLKSRVERAANSGYPQKAKWIEFSETMLRLGYTVELREATQSVSKYLTVWNLGRSFCVRYSNHGAHKIPNDSCDFFVGRNSFGVTNTAQAISATIEALGPSPLANLKK